MLKKLAITVFSLSLLSGVQLAQANGYFFKKHEAIYEVTITNITKGQTFTPQLLTSHKRQLTLFELGEPASDALATLAEAGNTGPLSSLLLNAGNAVNDVQTVDGLLGPGASVSADVLANPRRHVLSVAAMLIPTNDTFVGGDSLALPLRGARTYYLNAYDAGSEYNDQNCANIPGPRCGGAAESVPADSDEGFVHISNGFHDLGTEDSEGNEILGPLTYDWRNPVAKIVVKRLY